MIVRVSETFDSGLESIPVELSRACSLAIAAARAIGFSVCGFSVVGISAILGCAAVLSCLCLCACDVPSREDVDAIECESTDSTSELLVLLLSADRDSWRLHGPILIY
jgi:hypothetical protein